MSSHPELREIWLQLLEMYLWDTLPVQWHNEIQAVKHDLTGPELARLVTAAPGVNPHERCAQQAGADRNSAWYVLERFEQIFPDWPHSALPGTDALQDWYLALEINPELTNLDLQYWAKTLHLITPSSEYRRRRSPGEWVGSCCLMTWNPEHHLGPIVEEISRESGSDLSRHSFPWALYNRFGDDGAAWLLFFELVHDGMELDVALETVAGTIAYGSWPRGPSIRVRQSYTR